MSLTYQICEVTVTLPSLGTITTDGAGNQLKHGYKCRVHLYAVKPDWRSGSTFERFIVGWFTVQGCCEKPYKRSQKIMIPDGYKLVALMVDEYGIPTSWDSLPVHFTGGLIGNGAVSANYSVKVNRDTSEHHAASMAIGVEGEQPRVVFKADQFKVATGGPLTLTGVVLSEPMRKAVIKAVSESDLFKPLLSGLNEQAADITRLQLEIKDAVNDGIRNALKPGGLLWNNIRGR